MRSCVRATSLEFNPICLFEIPWRTLFGLFDSPRADMGLHVSEGVKDMILNVKLKFYKLELLGGLVI